MLLSARFGADKQDVVEAGVAGRFGWALAGLLNYVYGRDLIILDATIRHRVSRLKGRILRVAKSKYAPDECA